jgi:hypothetical protein
MSHHKENPAHGEDGHVCPSEQELTLKLPAGMVMGTLYALQTAMGVAAQDAITFYLEGKQEAAQSAAEANLRWGHSWLLVHKQALAWYEQFMAEHGYSAAGKDRDFLPGKANIPQAFIDAFEQMDKGDMN